MRKLVRDSAVPTSAGYFHHCGAKKEKSRDFDHRPLLALSDGGTRPVPVQVITAEVATARTWVEN